MFPLTEERIIIQVPARRVSRRNYRHPSRLYARKNRNQHTDRQVINRILEIALSDALTLRETVQRNMAIFALEFLAKEVNR